MNRTVYSGILSPFRGSDFRLISSDEDPEQKILLKNKVSC